MVGPLYYPGQYWGPGGWATTDEGMTCLHTWCMLLQSWRYHSCVRYDSTTNPLRLYTRSHYDGRFELRPCYQYEHELIGSSEVWLFAKFGAFAPSIGPMWVLWGAHRDPARVHELMMVVSVIAHKMKEKRIYQNTPNTSTRLLLCRIRKRIATRLQRQLLCISFQIGPKGRTSWSSAAS